MLYNVEHSSLINSLEIKIFKHLGCLLENHYVTTALTLEMSIANTNTIFRRQVFLSCILISSSLELYPLSRHCFWNLISVWRNGGCQLLKFQARFRIFLSSHSELFLQFSGYFSCDAAECCLCQTWRAFRCFVLLF